MNTETNYAEQCYASVSSDISTLGKNAQEYPFSSVARFLLLYHSKKNNDPSFDQLAKQSAIYFNNIPWIQYQLAGIDQNKITIEKNPDIKDERVTENILNNQPIVISETQVQPKAADARLNDSFGQDQINQNPDQYIKYETQTLGISEESQFATQEDSHETPPVADEQITQNPNQNIKYETEILGVSEERQFAVKEDSHETPAIADKQITQNPDQHIKYETETLGFSGENQIASIEQSNQTAATANEQITQNSDHDSENGEESISFEPLHTVDYFASQGIKISEEALENDHLGQQVKSFTAWLKSMKKLHPGQLPEQNEVIEKIIQSSAEVSNQSANVLTEAMAEVLIKQGKQEKAIEMFEKLSLMNPSKSAYFAAKIESLKTV